MKKTLTKLVAMLMVAAMAFSFVGFMPREANAAPVSILENDSPARKRSSEPAAEPDEIVPIIEARPVHGHRLRDRGQELPVHAHGGYLRRLAEGGV